MNLPHFQVGEIAIVAAAPLLQRRYIGQECEVTGGLRERTSYSKADFFRLFPLTMLCYVIETQDAELWDVPPEHLRKKFEPGSWADADSVFKPKRRVEELSAFTDVISMLGPDEEHELMDITFVPDAEDA